ncbi:MAG TPA: COX15/CtaA family protein [Burkholderiales bacterium]|nr:COX15/CtaA family protein [Burkholderiales bacterium]
MYRKLVLTAACLGYLVVVFGAFVRLSDAGLGCPDWPGCYGHVTVPQSEAVLGSAQLEFPNRPLDNTKAWIEMIHRYLAGTLGLLISAIAIYAWRKRFELRQSPALPLFLLGLVIVQALLGMWTVTLLLKPAVVSLHLLGGMATLAPLCWLARRQYGPTVADAAMAKKFNVWAWLGLVLLALQIALGGWVSANYAALACTDFPLCHGKLVPEMDFANAFHFFRELGMTAQGEPLSNTALNAIHWMHRLGAAVVFAYLGLLALGAIAVRSLRAHGMLLLVVLILQVALGIANVVFSLPLPLAVGHNAVAALLLVTVVVLNFKIQSAGAAVKRPLQQKPSGARDD